MGRSTFLAIFLWATTVVIAMAAVHLQVTMAADCPCCEGIGCLDHQKCCAACCGNGTT
ncbi:hypothetical protein ACP4OV_019166 [Aristida adscensionis]